MIHNKIHKIQNIFNQNIRLKEQNHIHHVQKEEKPIAKLEEEQ